MSEPTKAETTEAESWHDCPEHAWREIECQSEKGVVCTICQCPGEINHETGEVFWPAT